jgi:TRAP transporter TAXI family solute receptor
MTLTRRTLCRAAAAAVVAGCGTGTYRGPGRRITIAGGQPRGLYVKVAGHLAEEINRAEPGLHCEPKETRGSVENVELIAGGGADLAICQADVALSAVKGTDPFTSALPIVGIGRMYEDYLQVVVLKDSDLRSVADLAGRRVSVGAKRSGAVFTASRLMRAAGIEVLERFDSLDAAAAALRLRNVDAVVWSGGVPTEPLVTLDKEAGIRLLPLAPTLLTALRDRYGLAYQRVNIPAGVYGASGTQTIGMANFLLCRRSLPEDVVAAITGVLVERADRLVPRDSISTQFLDPPAVIYLLGVPKHPGAESAYRQLHG